MKKLSFSPLGDQAIVIDFGEGIDLEKNKTILEIKREIEIASIPGFIEAVPSYTTLTIFYDPLTIDSLSPYKTVKDMLYSIVSMPRITGFTSGKTVKIPVCYDETFALDLDIVAKHNNLLKQEVIEIHSNQSYHVYFLGFAPGFPFLGGMNDKIATPRKTSPRLKIPRGSVGIAGGQTGIYPLETPGGWQIIGRTPISLFQVEKHPPTLLLPGDQLRFFPISKEEFYAMEEK